MSELWDWQQTLSPAQWSAFGTMLTAVIAVVAAIFAWLQVSHARKLREDQAQPFVVVSFELSPVWDHAINLVVENIGNTLARDVRIAFDQPLESTSRTMDINESQLIKDGIRVMPPRMRLDTLFDLTHKRYDSGLPMVYTATVKYKGVRNKTERLEYTLDMGMFYGLEGLTEYGMHHVAKSLREIEKTLRKWNRSGRLGVAATDEDYRNWSDQWQRDRGGKHPTMAHPYPAGRSSPSKFDRLQEPLTVRLYWFAWLPVQRLLERFAERREDRRLEKAGRADLVLARKRARGEPAI